MTLFSKAKKFHLNFTKYFSTERVPLDSLVINSTPRSIKFTQYDDNTQKSVLLLPPLIPLININREDLWDLFNSKTLNYNNEVTISNYNLNGLYTLFIKTFKRLDPGYYTLSIYLYTIMDNDHEVYIKNSINDKYLDLVLSKSGYQEFGYMVKYIDNKIEYTNSQTLYRAILIAIFDKIKLKLDNKDFDKYTIGLDQETLLIITKLSKSEYYKKELEWISGRVSKNDKRFKSTGVFPWDFKRLYSTSTKLTSYSPTPKLRYYSTSHNKVNSRDNLDKLVFTNIKSILQSYPNNSETQIVIENFLNNQFSEYIKSKDKISIQGIDNDIFSSKFIQHCFDNIETLNMYIDKTREKLNSDNIDLNNIEDFDSSIFKNYLLRTILLSLDNDKIINLILLTFFRIVTYDNLYTPGDTQEDNTYHNSEVSTCVDLGKSLTSLFFKLKYIEYKDLSSDKSNKLNYTFSTFRDYYIKKNKYYVFYDESENSMFFGSVIVNMMIQCDFIKTKLVKVNKQSLSILTVSDKVRKLLNGNINKSISVPLNLPMIVKPKEYNSKELGGYLLNDVDYSTPLFTSKIAYKKTSEIISEGELYNIINNMMKTPFKINKELLEYLILNNHKYKLIIDQDDEHEFHNLKRRNKGQESSYQKFMSEKMLQDYILKIANTYKDVPEIFFPIMLDNRGRLYPRASYLNYQGSELAKSLLLFANYDVINRNDHTSIEYLLAYGSTCYGHGLNKRSYEVRVEWLYNNWDRILDFENNNIIEEADEKFLFLSFCFELKRFDSFLKSSEVEFKTYLPIQLDGTCNGFQHLALMSHELELFDSLNLSKIDKSEDPKDFYSHILTLLEGYLVEKYNSDSITKEKKEAYGRLMNIGLGRDNVKKVIMTKPYNSTDGTLSEYLRSSLIVDRTETSETNPDIKFNWYKVNKTSTHCINASDIRLIVETINEMLFVKYPKVKSLNEYLNKIAKFHNKLDIPIVWYLPTGLVVSQQYMMKLKRRVTPVWSSSRSLTLTITDKVKIDKKKQSRALMPNLVHSLDATTLCLLYKLFSNSINNSEVLTNKNINFYSVHDCYGITAPNVDLLIKNLQSTYINLYANKNYMDKFHNDIIDNIYKIYGKENCDYNESKGIIVINNVKYKIPKLPSVIDSVKTKVLNNLSKATYMIK